MTSTTPPVQSVVAVFDGLAERKLASLKADTDAPAQVPFQKVLDALREVVQIGAVKLTPSSLRCALAHNNPTPRNILVDVGTGQITGLLEWDYYSIMPAALAARYPDWLDYSGPNDSRLSNGQQAVEIWWLESAQESACYNALFEEASACRYV